MTGYYVRTGRVNRMRREPSNYTAGNNAESGRNISKRRFNYFADDLSFISSLARSVLDIM